jgi:hypothetical protein
MEKKERDYKEMRKKKHVALLKRLIVDMGSLPIAFYIAVSAIWIAVSSCLYAYSTNYQLYNILFREGFGNDIISGFVYFGILVFIVVLVIGIGCTGIYRANVLLLERGEKKTKSYLAEVLQKKKEKEEK